MADFLKSLKVKGVEIDTSGATSGQVFQYNGTKFLPTAPSGGATISDTPPVSPTAGQFWFESDTGKTFVYYDSFWVEVSGGGGFRSGVVTSSTRPTNPFEGQIIYETDTNRVLVYDNTAWVMIANTDSPPGLQLIKTESLPTGQNSVTISNAFSSEFDNYKITISNGSTSSSQRIDLRMGTTNTGYYYSLIYHPYATASGTPVGIAGNNVSEWQYTAWTTTSQVSFNVDVDQPFLSKNTFLRSQHIQYVGQVSGSLAGFLDNNTSYTSFTLALSGGATFTGGTVRVYGYRN